MKRLILSGALSLLAAGLSACSSSASAPSGGRPPLPTGVEVRFPTAPANAFLSLLTDSGASAYDIGVAGKTSTEVDPARWAARSANAQLAATWVPAGAQGTPVISSPTAKVNFLRWVMWQDKNNNLTRDAGEDLDLMTHDRVAYASEAVTVSFTTATPDMKQTWTLAKGWSRAEHYVYLPFETTTYIRSLDSVTLNRFTLHVTTPVTSQ